MVSLMRCFEAYLILIFHLFICLFSNLRVCRTPPNRTPERIIVKYGGGADATPFNSPGPLTTRNFYHLPRSFVEPSSGVSLGDSCHYRARRRIPTLGGATRKANRTEISPRL